MSRYRVPDGVLKAEMSGEQVLLNPATGVYHLVNATGLVLLTEMDAGKSLEDAIRALSQQSGQSVETVETDAAAFIESMVQRGLLSPWS